MAVSVVASTTGTSTATLPAGTTTGDIVVAFAYGSSATVPTLPGSWTNIVNNGSAMSARVQYRVYDGVWTMPTFTNAATTHAVTLRGQDTVTPIGTSNSSNLNQSNVVWPTVTLADASGQSRLLRGVAHTRPDSVIAAPSGHTSLQAAGTQPGYFTGSKTVTTDGLTATSTISRGTTYTQVQVEIRCVYSGGTTQNAAVAFTASSGLTVTGVRSAGGSAPMAATATLTADGTQSTPDTVDPDTRAYLTATGLNEATYGTTLDGLVTGLKSNGLWSKMTAIYPMIGGTAALHKWNLKDPRDLDTAFRLTFLDPDFHSGHSTALGYRANSQGAGIGSGSYADTHLTPLGTLADVNSTHLAFYSLEDTPSADRAEMGCYNWAGSGSRFHIIARYLGVDSFYYGMSEEGANHYVVPAASGLFVATRTSASAQRGYRNGVPGPADSFAPTNGLPDRSVFIGAINEFANRSDIPCGFASIGSGLNDADVTALWSVVEAYQAALGRATTVVAPVTQNGAANLTAAAALTAAPVRTAGGTAPLAATSSLTAVAVRAPNQAAAAALTATSTLPFLTALRTVNAGATLTAASTLTSTATTAGGAFTPDTLAGLVAWIDATQDAFTDGQPITAYTEHSSAHRVLTYASNTPMYRANSVNGMPRLDFNLAGMSCDNVTLGATGFTYVMVHQSHTVNSFQMMWTFASGGDGYEMRYNGNEWATQAVIRYAPYGIVFASSIVEAPDTDYIHTLVSTAGGSSDIRVNDVIGATGGAPPVALTAPATLRLGFRDDGYYFNGLVAEALVYDHPLSDTDRLAINDYLRAKWFAPAGPATVNATAALAATSTLTATGTRSAGGTAPLASTATLTAVATKTSTTTATVTLTASSFLFAAATTTPATGAAVTLTATATLTATGSRATTATVTLTATSSLSTTGVRGPQATVTLVATATLVGTGLRIVPALVTLTAAATLTGDGVRQQLVGIPNAAHTGYLYALGPDHKWGLVSNPMS